MRVALTILALLLIVFGGGCVVILAPFTSPYFEGTEGRSLMNDVTFWGPIIGLIALPMLISGVATLCCLLLRRRGNGGGVYRFLTIIDLTGLVALAFYFISLMGRMPTVGLEVAIFGIYAALFVSKINVQRRLLKAGS